MDSLNTSQALRSIRELIKLDCAQMLEPDGYVDKVDLVKLTDEQAEIAIRYGIPIGMKSIYDGHHGIHKGEYGYRLVDSMDSVRECRWDRTYNDRPSIYPYLPDPKKMVGYIEQIAELELNGMATTCLNGELKPGDLVIASPDDAYAYMVGSVLSIDKTHTPERGTGERTDCVHVNFMDARYSQNRLREIEQQLGELYGRPTSPGVLPPVDVEDVVLEPNMLFRITDVGREELKAILDSEEKAAAFVQNIEEIRTETPAQAALHEPDIYSDKTTADLREKLVKRLDGNLTDYLDALQNDSSINLTGMSSEIAAMAGAHYYLTEIHNFHRSELEYLMKFQNPLEVVADQFELELEIEDHSAIMWNIFDKQDALLGGYELMDITAKKATETVSLQESRDSLLERIAEKHCRIETLQTRKSDSLDFHDVSVWGLKSALEDAFEAGVERQAEQALENGCLEKPSVLEQIHRARQEAKVNPAPKTEVPGKVREPER